MGNKIGLLAVSFLLLLIAPLCANSADSVVFDGDLRISGLGSLVFPDGSVQYSATVQGPTGQPGPMGPMGPQGPSDSTESSYSSLNYYSIGDSITHGAGSTSGSHSYADILHVKFTFNSLTKLAVAPGCEHRTPNLFTS